MVISTRYLGGIGLAIIFLFLASPSSAQIEDQISAYTGINATGYMQPLADALGADLNDGLFHSAYIPDSGVHISFGIRVMSVIFGDDDKTFNAKTESGFTPEQTVDAPTVVGSGEAKIITGDGGTSFAFPGGFDLHSFALAVPQLRIGAFHGTEALIRYFAVNTGDVELGDLSLFGFGLRHSLSQYMGPDFPAGIAAGFFWQKFSLGDDLVSASAFTFGLQASKRFTKGLASLEPYTGFSVDISSMDISYESDASGIEEDIDLDFETNKTVHLTLGLSFDFSFINLHGEYNIASQNSFSFGVAFGN